MNRVRLARSIVGAVSIAALLVSTTPARAATATSNIAVSANVVAVCVLTAGTLSFGTYDPVNANASTPLDATTQNFTVACTKGTGYTVSLDYGQHASGTTRNMLGTSGDPLQYEIYTDAGHQTIWNATNTVGGTAGSVTPVTLTGYGRIPANRNVGVGSYTDTVQATVNF